ncbi:hypothetical protein B0A50_08624 [Salinomyces thailandicus]|uniref:Enoyl reductase (ER) domain-containing protein n=1 Tax=Salinomyces thailandicus TaxID=706561 RepID=A0A4U0TJ78_9PEZI|nr:hypothetical protein B0A50_08624 [Salinomyces thailandica]
MSTNEAAWLSAPKTHPLEVGSAEYPSAKEDEIVVRVHAAGIDPVDNKIQSWHLFGLPTPIVLGNGVAGEVVETGSGVTRVRVGQRVVGNTTVLMSKEARNGGYQRNVALPAPLFAPLPDSLPYTQAAVLPVGMSTAAAALFNPDSLGLPMPPTKAPNSPTLMVWGGSSSVGLCAIQLAKLVGARCVVTASSKNARLCKDVGADAVVDHQHDDCEKQLAEALQGGTVVGALDAISSAETIPRTCRVLSQTGSAGTAKVALTVPPMQEIDTHGVELKPIFSLSILGNQVARTLWEEVLPRGLASGELVAQPPAMVEDKKGPQGVQPGLDRCAQGMSASKVVVTMV